MNDEFKTNPKELVFSSEKDQSVSIILNGSKRTKVSFVAAPNHMPSSLEAVILSVSPVASWSVPNLALPINVPLSQNYSESPASFTIQALRAMSLAFTRDVTVTFRLRYVENNDDRVQFRTFVVMVHCPDVQIAR